jgi:hypothetical protein
MQGGDFTSRFPKFSKNGGTRKTCPASSRMSIQDDREAAAASGQPISARQRDHFARDLRAETGVG